MLGASLAALAVSALPAAGFAQTQDNVSAADESAVADVIVVGARAAEQSAINRKKRAATAVDSIVAERTRMLTGLRAQGWKVPDSQANFVWLPLGEHAKSFADRSARAGVLVRPFAGDGVRVSVGEPEATDLLLEVTAEAAPR